MTLDVVVGRAKLQLPHICTPFRQKKNKCKRRKKKTTTTFFKSHRAAPRVALNPMTWNTTTAPYVQGNLVKCYKCLYHGHQQKQCALAWCNLCATWGHNIQNCAKGAAICGGNRRATVQENAYIIKSLRTKAGTGPLPGIEPTTGPGEDRDRAFCTGRRPHDDPARPVPMATQFAARSTMMAATMNTVSVRHRNCADGACCRSFTGRRMYLSRVVVVEDRTAAGCDSRRRFSVRSTGLQELLLGLRHRHWRRVRKQSTVRCPWRERCWVLGPIGRRDHVWSAVVAWLRRAVKHGRCLCDAWDTGDGLGHGKRERKAEGRGDDAQPTNRPFFYKYKCNIFFFLKAERQRNTSSTVPTNDAQNARISSGDGANTCPGTVVQARTSNCVCDRQIAHGDKSCRQEIGHADGEAKCVSARNPEANLLRCNCAEPYETVPAKRFCKQRG